VGEGIDDVDDAPAIAQRIVEFEAEIEDAKREFVFKAVGQRAWQALIKANPPTEQQRQASTAFQRVDHNPDTFPAAAVSASCISPKMTLEQAKQFEEILDVSAWAKIYAACLDANVGGGDSPKSVVAGGIARANAGLGKQPTTSEYPDLSSLDE
jgi:hypothetical protein